MKSVVAHGGENFDDKNDSPYGDRWYIGRRLHYIYQDRFALWASVKNNWKKEEGCTGQTGRSEKRTANERAFLRRRD